MPTSTRSSPRSSSATTPRLRGRPTIVGSGVVMAASYEARALRRARGDGRSAGPAAVPAGGRGRRLGSPPTSRRARRCSRCSNGRRRSSRACRWRRPSSTSAGLERISGSPLADRHAAASRRPRAGRPADHGRRRPYEGPGEDRQRRRETRRPARRPARERARVSPPAAGGAAVGRGPCHRREAARSGDHDRRRARRRSPRRLSSRCSGGRRAATSTTSLTTAIPGRVRAGRRRRSIGSQSALGRASRSPDALDARLVGLVDRVTRRMRASGRRRAHGGAAACASATSRARPDRTRFPAPPRPPGPSSRRRGRCWRRRCR